MARKKETLRNAGHSAGRIFIFLFILAAGLVFSCCTDKNNKTLQEAGMAQFNQDNLPEGVYAEIDTNRGSILLSLEYKKTPLTVSNFVGLAEGTITNTKGKGPFYDGLVFHRVIDNFMIQGGDPRGNGSGGPGYKFPDEFDPSLRHDGPGVLSMANSGPGTNGSQFFITHTATAWLDGKHSVFGRVVQGQDVVDSIRQGDKINRVKIIRVGAEAEAFRPDDESFQGLIKKAAENEKALRDSLHKEVLDEIRRRWPDLRETPEGLMYQVLREGSGSASPQYGQRVTVDYEGTLLDGTKFDSSFDRGEPAVFRVGQVIPGWNQALQDMKKGEKRLLVIPPDLGYGAQGYPGIIPGDAYLVFEVELLDF